MSKVETGQVGQFSGKIGPLVVFKWRGILAARKTPTKSNKPPTEDQLDQQQKFGKVSAFLSMFADAIAIGWASTRLKVTPVNEAVSYHMEKAVGGQYPKYHIQYENVLVSRGRGIIDGGFRPVAVAGNDLSVEISWDTCSTTQRITQPTDRLTVIFLDENLRPGMVRPIHYEQIAMREDLKVSVTLPEMCKDHPLHVYMFFTSENNKLASKSEYLGVVTP